MAESSIRKLAVGLTLSLFALWGFGHRLYDTLVPPFAKVFDLSSLALVLTQSVYAITYFLFAIPAGLYVRKFGYKATMVFGLGAFAIGAFLFYPAAEQHAFPFFIFAATVMAIGWISLEVSANPFLARLGPVENIPRTLNFGHALFPVGVLIGVYTGRWVILSDLSLPADRLAQAVVQPCIVIGAAVLVLAFVFDKVPFPPLASERVSHGAGREIRTLLTRPLFVLGMVAQFAYVAAQAGTWGMATRYVESALPGISATSSADVLLWCLVLYGVGRFVATALMYRFDPGQLLAAFATSGLVLSAVATGLGGKFGVICMMASSLSMSMMFPTILGLSIRDLGPLMNTGTALVYTGGAGGAVGLIAMHLVWTISSVQYSMLVPCLSYAVVLAFAMAQPKPGRLPSDAAIHPAE